MPAPLIITLDGPAGVGKSTLARRLAAELGLPCLDTGAMFRFLALKLGSGAASLPTSELRDKAGYWQFSLAGTGEDSRLMANGKSIGSEIRAEAVSKLASDLATRPEIREILADAQRNLGSKQSLVAEGRDMGTVVFPDAQVKIFLDASPEVRAQRRWRELQQKGIPADVKAIEASIRQRDAQDRNRPIAPLKPAKDAVVVDTSSLRIDDVLKRILEICREKINGSYLPH